MSERQPGTMTPAGSVHIRSIVVDILLTIITCGLFNLYIQYKQIRAVNDILGQAKYSFLIWFILLIPTCGLYHIYHEYRMCQDLCLALNRPQAQEPLISIILTVFGLSIVADAIQQTLINEFYGDNAL